MLRRQAASGTAIWLRGAWHRFLSNKRAMHRSVLLHMRLISELRLYKIEQCRNLLEARPLWENLGSVQFYTDLFPPCAQAPTDTRPLSQGRRTAFQLLLFRPASKKGHFRLAPSKSAGRGVPCLLSNRLARLPRKCCVQYAGPVCDSRSSNPIITASTWTTISLLAARAMKFRPMCSTVPQASRVRTRCKCITLRELGGRAP